MKQSFHTALFLAFSLSLQSQAPVKTSYAMSPAYDAGTSIHAVSDGFVIFGNVRPNGNGSPYDIFRLQVDRQGQQVSLLKFGVAGTSESIGSGVVAFSDGWLLAGEKAAKGYLLRLSSSGTVLWSKEIPGAGPFTDAAVLPDGGIVATGKMGGKMFVAKMLSDGTPEWIRSYTTGSGNGLSLSSNNGNCFVAGSDKLWKIRLADGAMIWEKTIVPPSYGPDGGYQTIQLRDITAAGPGQFAITGAYVNDQIFSLYSAYYVGMWKEAGELVWEKFYRGTESVLDVNESNSLFYMPNSQDLLVAGTESGEASAMRLDASGRPVDSVALGINGYNIVPVIIKAGAYYAVTGATLGGFQNMNTFFYRSAGNALRSDMETPTSEWMLAPNPATGLVTLQFYHPVEQKLQVNISDVSGRTVLQSREAVIPGVNQISVDLSRLPAGLYWINLPATGLPPKMVSKQ